MKVLYKGCSNEQVKWGNNDDPRRALVEGEVYEILNVEKHSWHTKYTLAGFVGQFNSVCFIEVED